MTPLSEYRSTSLGVARAARFASVVQRVRPVVVLVLAHRRNDSASTVTPQGVKVIGTSRIRCSRITALGLGSPARRGADTVGNVVPAIGDGTSFLSAMFRPVIPSARTSRYVHPGAVRRVVPGRWISTLM